MEFELMNTATKETTIRYGSGTFPEWNKWKLNPNEWEVIFVNCIYSEFYEM